MGTPRHDNWQRATEGASHALAVLRGKARAATGERDVLGRMKRAPSEAERVLRNLRTDIAAGLPRAALLERVDDELYRLSNPKP